jgi:hypothetical protein
MRDMYATFVDKLEQHCPEAPTGIASHKHVRAAGLDLLVNPNLPLLT